MLILGLNLGHDPSAALVDQDGHVHAATHEARYTRLKKERRFPANAIASALRAAKCDAADVDIVAYSSYEPDDLALIRDKFLCGVGDMRRAPRELIEGQLHQLGIRPTEIVREEHHFVHACAAMRACPTPDPLIVTSDGYGDGISFTIRRAESGRVPSSCLMKAPVNASLGLVYQYVTGGLGYSMLSEEWKVLGLEPYGDPQGAACLFEDLHDGHVGIAEWNTTALERWSFMAGDESPSSSRELRDSLRRYLELRVPQFDRRDVASALQDYLEGRVLGELERFGGTEQTALALGGGTFLNVRLNRMLSELAWVSEVSVFPAAGDGGNSVGAALAYLQRTSELPPVHGVDNVYWGEGYSRLASGLQWGDGLLAKPAMAEDEVIEYLSSAIADGRVVAIFRGRGEYGPRALLHRSVVCKADRPDLHDMLNEQLRRDPVMPFGCSMLDSDAKFALGRVGALGPCLRFMIAAPLVRQDFGRQYRPVCHATREGGFPRDRI